MNWRALLQILWIKHPLELAWLVRVSHWSTRRPARAGQSADRSFPQAAVTKNSLRDIALPAFNEADDLHYSATLTFQRVDFVHPFDQPGPGRNRTAARVAVSGFLHIERRSTDSGRCRLRLLGLPQLGLDAAVPVRVPAVVAHQMIPFLRDVLRQFGQEVECAKDLEVAPWSTTQIATGWVGKAAVVFFGPIDHRSVVGQPDHARQAERATQNILGQTLQTERVARCEVHTVIDAETTMGPRAHLVLRRLVDLVGGYQRFENSGLPRLEQQLGAAGG